MKKDKMKIGNVEIDYVETYEKEVTEVRKKEYESKLAKIPTIEEKLKFTKTELVEYLKNLPPEVIYVSGQTNIQGALFWDRYLKIEIDSLEAELKNQRNIGKRKKYSNKEIALAYILEIYSTGKTIPKSSQGELANNELENIGESEYNAIGDSFYRAVREIIILKKYDLNKEDDLNHISKNWYNAIKEISTKRNKWDDINEYLKTKGIPKG